MFLVEQLSQIFLHRVFFTNFNRSHSSMTLFWILIWSFISLSFLNFMCSFLLYLSTSSSFSIRSLNYVFIPCHSTNLYIWRVEKSFCFSVDLTFCSSFIRTITSWAKLIDIMIILLGSSKLTQTFCLHCMGNNATFTIVESSIFHV